MKEQESTFIAWVEVHQGLLLKIARAHEANPEELQDLLQEILVQLWRSIPAYAGNCSETTWIYRVALNTAFAWRRRETKRRRSNEAVAAFVATAYMDSASSEVMSARAELEQLYAAIRHLPPGDSALILMHLDGLSGREISDVLGITENNAAVKLSRARKQLQALLTENI